MAKWSQSFTAKTEKDVHNPVYALILCEDWTYARPNDAALDDAVGVAETSLQLPSDGEFDTAPGDLLIIYDVEGFEFVEVSAFNTGTQNIGSMTRGQCGTNAKNFDRGAVVAKPLAMFATQPVIGSAPLSFRVGMGFPSGGGQDIDLRDGKTNVDDVTVEVQDRDGWIPKNFKKNPVIGLRAIILGAYEGMPFNDYSFLWVGSVTELSNFQTNVYSFVIDSIFSKLKKELFGDIEDFDTTLTNNRNSTDTSFNIENADTAYLNSGAQTMGTADGWAVENICGIVYKIGDEYILSSGGTGNTISVAIGGRGYWGSTAASHSIGDEVDVVFSFQGHPIEFLLGLLLTKQTDTDSLNWPSSLFTHYDWGSVVDIDRDPLALGLEFGDVETSTFLAIREKWFSDYVFRYKLGKRLDMESFIPKNILKPLGLALFVNRAGKLALGIMKPPSGTDVAVFDRFVGVPTIKYDATEVVNECVVKFDYDGSEFADEARLIDGASQVTYGRQDAVTLDCIGLDSALRAESVAPRIARRKIRPIKDPNPVVSVECLFSHVGRELTEVIRFRHPDMPDIGKGAIGWDRLCMIVGKRVDWSDGTLIFDVIDTKYFGKRYGNIAPSGTADYSAASDETKDSYVFIADSPSELLSDGSEAYLIS